MHPHAAGDGHRRLGLLVIVCCARYSVAPLGAYRVVAEREGRPRCPPRRLRSTRILVDVVAEVDDEADLAVGNGAVHAEGSDRVPGTAHRRQPEGVGARRRQRAGASDGRRDVVRLEAVPVRRPGSRPSTSTTTVVANRRGDRVPLATMSVIDGSLATTQSTDPPPPSAGSTGAPPTGGFEGRHGVGEDMEGSSGVDTRPLYPRPRPDESALRSVTHGSRLVPRGNHRPRRRRP